MKAIGVIGDGSNDSTLLTLSESQVLIYKYHVDPVFMPGESGDKELTADAFL